MGWFKKKEPSFYEQQAADLKAEIRKTKVGTPEYDQLVRELNELVALCGKEKEQRQILTKDSKGKILSKIVGYLGLGALTFTICGFEKSGHMFTGSSGDKGLIGSIIKLAGSLFNT